VIDRLLTSATMLLYNGWLGVFASLALLTCRSVAFQASQNNNAYSASSVVPLAMYCAGMPPSSGQHGNQMQLILEAGGNDYKIDIEDVTMEADAALKATQEAIEVAKKAETSPTNMNASAMTSSDTKADTPPALEKLKSIVVPEEHTGPFESPHSSGPDRPSRSSGSRVG
jgi:hypothetical protein